MQCNRQISHDGATKVELEMDFFLKDEDDVWFGASLILLDFEVRGKNDM